MDRITLFVAITPNSPVLQQTNGLNPSCDDRHVDYSLSRIAVFIIIFFGWKFLVSASCRFRSCVVLKASSLWRSSRNYYSKQLTPKNAVKLNPLERTEKIWFQTDCKNSKRRNPDKHKRMVNMWTFYYCQEKGQQRPNISANSPSMSKLLYKWRQKQNNNKIPLTQIRWYKLVLPSRTETSGNNKSADTYSCTIANSEFLAQLEATLLSFFSLMSMWCCLDWWNAQ